jgi:hypothetical protein
MPHFLARQTRLPDHLVICPVAPGDVDSEALERFPALTLVVSGPVGLPLNAIGFCRPSQRQISSLSLMTTSFSIPAISQILRPFFSQIRYGMGLDPSDSRRELLLLHQIKLTNNRGR